MEIVLKQEEKDVAGSKLIDFKTLSHGQGETSSEDSQERCSYHPYETQGLCTQGS